MGSLFSVPLSTTSTKALLVICLYWFGIAWGAEIASHYPPDCREAVESFPLSRRLHVARQRRREVPHYSTWVQVMQHMSSRRDYP